MRRLVLGGFVFVVGACGNGSDAPSAAPPTITVASPAFAEGGTIPRQYTCQGAEVSPPLQWSGVPAGTEELRVVVDDPDAPGATFTHWKVDGIDPATTGLEEGRVPPGAKATTYKGMCPPSGTHHYRFTVYARRGSSDVARGTLTGVFGSG